MEIAHASWFASIHLNRSIHFRSRWIFIWEIMCEWRWKIITSGLSLGEHGQQHGEVDGSRCVVDHLVEFLLGSDATQLVESGAQIVLAEDAILVAIHQLESLLEFGHLLLTEHREDIAARTLDFLLLLRSRWSLGRRLLPHNIQFTWLLFFWL